MCTFACVLRVETRCFFIFDDFCREVFTKQHFVHQKRRPASSPNRPKTGSGTPMPDGEIGLWGGPEKPIRDGEKRVESPGRVIPDGIFEIGPDRARFGVLIFYFFYFV